MTAQNQNHAMGQSGINDLGIKCTKQSGSILIQRPSFHSATTLSNPVKVAKG